MTILIVDDNEMNLYQLQVLLGGNGYPLVTAANGAEALAQARQDPPDLIVSDILMPVMDGFTLCREWMQDERLRPIPFIFYTATYTDDRDREFALSLGAARFLVKPEEPEVLLQTIRDVLQQVRSSAPPAEESPSPPAEEVFYLKQYNEVLIHKLENKMEQLERANLKLEQDIVERKRADMELQTISTELQLIFKNMINAFVIWESVFDENGKYVSFRFGKFNNAYARISKLKYEEVQGKDVFEVWPATEQSWVDMYGGVAVTGIPVTFDMYHEPTRGWYHCNVYRPTDSPLQVCAIFEDITGRKMAEEALQTSQSLLNETGKMAKVGGWEFDVETMKQVWTEEMYHIHELDLDYEPDVNKGFDFYTPESRPVIAQAVERAIESGEPFDLQLQFITAKGNHRWVHDIGKAYRQDGKTIRVSGTFQDITDSKRAEEEKEKLQTQLNQAQKMELVGRLAGGVAHDFNNMLSVILGHAELALDQVDPAQPLHADLEEICKAATRSADLTRQLLAFARKQTVAPRVLDLNNAVSGMLKMLQRLIGEDIELAWLPDPSLWSVKVDPSQIDQILANLCVNARDAIAGVGRIAIETGNSSFDADYCAVHAGFVPGEYVRLVVSDNGCGMDRETQAHIFEPFFTTKGVGEGTGLGLATVYGSVKQNNGFINVYSEPGQGTAFTIYLARHRGLAEKVRKEGTVAPAGRGHETVLLVEDEPAILELTAIMLGRLGYTVLAAPSPGEAIRLAGEYVGQIHLLMTDVVMPEMNGRDLARNLLSLYPQLKHLFMSGYTADVIAHHGVLDEGVQFIQKPFSIKDLASSIREALS